MPTNDHDEGAAPSTVATSTAAEGRARPQRSLARDLGLGLGLPFAAAMLVIGLASALAMRSAFDRLAERAARASLDSAEAVLRGELDGSMLGFLRAEAESGREILAGLDDRASRGGMSKAQAYASAWRALSGARIGASGFYAAVDGQGRWILHPPLKGEEAGELARRVRSLGEGFLRFGPPGGQGPGGQGPGEQGPGEQGSDGQGPVGQGPGGQGPGREAAFVLPYAPRDLSIMAVADEAAFLGSLGVGRLDGWLRPSGLRGAANFFLVDSAGKPLIGADPFGLARSAGPEPTFVSAGGGRFLVLARLLPEGPWKLVSATAMAPYDRLAGAFAAVLALVLILAAAAVGLGLRAILARRLRPIRDMREVADKVSSGDLGARVETAEDDEIGEAALIYNRAMDEFAGLLSKVRAVIASLAGSIQNLSTSTQEIASTSNEQAASVKEVLSTMEDADRLSKGVEVKIQEVARIATHTKDNVGHGFELIQDSLGKMEEIRSTNAQTLAGIKTLGDLIETIWDIVNIINGIADQTKIIAFNAELEAAAAGEAGKNFRIVADEIRRLADGTVDSTNEIKQKIDEIQRASDKLIFASEEGTQRIREGWDISSNIRGVFEDVMRSSEISADSANDISRSINMQVVSFDQIFLTLKQISESIDNFVESTSYTTEVSDRLKSISESFKAQLEAYSVDGRAAGKEEG